MAIPKIAKIAKLMSNDGSHYYLIQSDEYDTQESAKAGMDSLNAALMELGEIATTAIANGWNPADGNQRVSVFFAESMEALKKLKEIAVTAFNALNNIIVTSEKTITDLDLEEVKAVRDLLKNCVPAHN